MRYSTLRGRKRSSRKCDYLIAALRAAKKAIDEANTFDELLVTAMAAIEANDKGKS